MDDELKDILNNLNKDTEQDVLLKYLNGKLGREEMHEVEKHLLDDEFESDAVDGLQQIEDSKMQLIVDALNRDLKKRTQKKQRTFEKRTLKPQWWLYFSIILLLIILALIYMYLHNMLLNVN
ncbi:MAG: hypothetical protein ACK5NK_01375 [Niabella sp.]